MNQVRFGLDVLRANPGGLRGRIGLVTNEAARTSLDPSLTNRAALLNAGFQLVRLFSPEHGLRASATDGAQVADSVDPLTGLPVVSLYGETLCPPPAALADLDAVGFDLPDIGARFYTYIWTLSHVLEACAEARVPLVVLDRPNPLGGELSAAEGPLLDVENFRSFVGRAAIPIRHSLTSGELARLWNAEWNLDADLRIIACSGWTRAMHWPDTGLPFVQTSPAIASYKSALLYPGLGLFEATNLSVGRGTNCAFQVIGAPWLRADEVARHFNAYALPGVTVQTENFVPTLAPYSGECCAAVRLLVSDAKSVRPVSAGLHLLATVVSLHPKDFGWAKYPTAANPAGEKHFERLVGRADIREALELNPHDLSEQVKAWTAVPTWGERVRRWRLYD